MTIDNQTLERPLPLPPGLHLPTADEDPDKFRSENYHPKGLEDWQVLDFGSFVVALAAFDVAEGNRVSLKPLRDDLVGLRSEGYGPSARMIQKFYHSYQGLQHGLGFSVKQVTPDRDELLTRFEYIADNLLDPKEEFGDQYTMLELLTWCSMRDLAPYIDTAREVLGGSLNDVRVIFGAREKDVAPSLTHTDLYRFGAKVLDEQKKVPLVRELKQKYQHAFGIDPVWAIGREYTNTNRFWLEFDRVRDTHGMTSQQVVNLGTRYAIRTGDRELPFVALEEAANQHLLPSLNSYERHLDGIRDFRGLVQRDLEAYDALVGELAEEGISADVVQAFCGKFEPTDEFQEWLHGGKDILVKLSQNSEDASYILRLLRDGLDLLHEPTYNYQLRDLKKHLKSLGISKRGDMRFVFTAVPRLNPNEALKS